MCGRYVRKKGKKAIAETFNISDVPEFAMPDADYNIAPTTYQPISSEPTEAPGNANTGIGYYGVYEHPLLRRCPRFVTRVVRRGVRLADRLTADVLIDSVVRMSSPQSGHVTRSLGAPYPRN